MVVAVAVAVAGAMNLVVAVAMAVIGVVTFPTCVDVAAYVVAVQIAVVVAVVVATVIVIAIVAVSIVMAAVVAVSIVMVMHDLLHEPLFCSHTDPATVAVAVYVVVGEIAVAIAVLACGCDYDCSFCSHSGPLADRLDAERMCSGPRGPMHGVPVLVKDNIDTAGGLMRTTAGSLALMESRPAADAHVVTLLKNAGRCCVALLCSIASGSHTMQSTLRICPLPSRCL